MSKKPSQLDMFYREHRRIADLNSAFLDMINDGMTKHELEKLIEKRPNVYGRFSSWIERLN